MLGFHWEQPCVEKRGSGGGIAFKILGLQHFLPSNTQISKSLQILITQVLKHIRWSQTVMTLQTNNTTSRTKRKRGKVKFWSYLSKYFRDNFWLVVIFSPQGPGSSNLRSCHLSEEETVTAEKCPWKALSLAVSYAGGSQNKSVCILSKTNTIMFCCESLKLSRIAIIDVRLCQASKCCQILSEKWKNSGNDGIFVNRLWILQNREKSSVGKTCEQNLACRSEFEFQIKESANCKGSSSFSCESHFSS